MNNTTEDGSDVWHLGHRGDMVCSYKAEWIDLATQTNKGRIPCTPWIAMDCSVNVKQPDTCSSAWLWLKLAR